MSFFLRAAGGVFVGHSRPCSSRPCSSRRRAAWRAGGLAARCWLAALALVASTRAEEARAENGHAERRVLRVLFLGDQGHHRPAERFRVFQPFMAARGIAATYTENVGDLNPKTLAGYDGLILYANITSISPEQENALLEYVAGGKGFIPLHCASYCFLNSPKYVALVGAQFQRHGVGVFRVGPEGEAHPLLRGYGGFESWDETYVHHQHNEQDRTVLEYRRESGAEGQRGEPWTWIRAHGKGRVFYTAWGHDDRTWGHAGFHNLVERGVRWAVGDDPGAAPSFADRPAMTKPRVDVKPFEYVDAKVPFYPGGPKWGAQGEPITKMQLPLPAEESLKHFVRPEGMDPRLFAAEPDIGKPLCLNWDERGRLWLCETVDYPNELRPEGAGRDRIRVCEDTDGDGRADKFTVFADKLSIATSLAFCQGGVIVHQAPHTLFLRDNDGDGVADQRDVLFTGWSTGDTHAGPSNLRYGLDNWYYGMVGYAGFEGEIAGQRHSFRTGFYRFRVAPPAGPSASGRPAPPRVVAFEFLRNTNNNSWGVGFSEEGVLFGSTANGNPSVYLPIPNRYYEAVRGWSSSVLGGIAENARFFPVSDKVRQVDHHGNFTAAAGHALYTARTYPREYWNRVAFVTDPTGKLAAAFTLQASGADYRAKNSWNLLASDDEWSAPIMAEVGPDGHVWVIDWYNYISQHNPTPAGYKTGKGNAYETDLRDKKHGRVYRVVYAGAPAAAPLSLAGAAPDTLVAALAHDNMFWRLHAQRLLVERGSTDAAAGLAALARDPGQDSLGLNVGAIHATWTLRGLAEAAAAAPQETRAALEGEARAVATANLKHVSAGARRAAVLSLPRDEAGLQALLAANPLADFNDQARLAALLTLAETPPSPAAAQALQAALRDETMLRDRWLMEAATAAAARHAGDFLPLVDAPANAPTAPEPLLKLTAIVAEHVARSGDGAALAGVLPSLNAKHGQVAGAIVAGFAKGFPADKALPLSAEAEQKLVQLLPRLPADARGLLARLAARSGSQEFTRRAAEVAQAMLAEVANDKATDAQRLAAARQVLELLPQDAAAAQRVLAAISPKTSPELAGGLLEALAQSRAPQVGAAVLARQAEFTPALRAGAMRLLLSRGEWTTELLGGLEQGRVSLADLTLDQKQALANHPQTALAARAKTLLAKAGGLPSPDRQRVLDEWRSVADRKGDPTLGKAAFVKFCAKCHVHGGEGARVGPDLTGMAVHPKLELLTQILDPSRSVEGNFRAYLVALDDGRVFTGLLASETKTTLELFDAEGKKHVLPRDEIEQLKATPKSLMPEGFEKQLSPDEMAHLLEFLTQRGKFLPLPLDKAATIVSTKGMFYDAHAAAERLIFPDWSPKTFAGVPFQLVDPQGEAKPNVILLHGPEGLFPPKMPKSVSLPCHAPAKAIHLLSGVSGWGYPYGEKGSVTMIVRLRYADGAVEEHPLKNGEHFADYIRRVDVPGSQFAFALRGQQARYLAIHPKRADVIETVELVKGPDRTAPVVLAVTVETADAGGE